MSSLYRLFVTCPAGLEELLKLELEQLGLTGLRQTVTGVFVDADAAALYRINLWSRLANRVLLLLAESPSGDREQLYEQASSIDWSEHMAANARFRVDFSGSNQHIRHSQFGAQVIKDAIVDQFLARGPVRPEVDLKQAQLRVNVRLTKKHLYISLDLSGDSLHRRGYRAGGGMAPLKENLAAALLIRAGWPELIEQSRADGSDLNLIDPMCGSGTLIIEAAMMACRRAPGLLREQWGFEAWQQHQARLWSELKREASEAEHRPNFAVVLRGAELDIHIAAQARENIKRAGFDAYVHLQCENFLELEAQSSADLDKDSAARGLLICNPPYGMRLGEQEKLSVDYQSLAALAKEHYPGWRLALFSSNMELLAQTRLRCARKYKLHNGPIPCELRLYELNAEATLRDDSRAGAGARLNVELDEGGQMLANRLRKNLNKLKSWLKTSGIEAYRVYDADLPEYSSAIDVYGDYLHIQEYQAPSSVDARKAKQRLHMTVAAAAQVFAMDRAHISLKTRQRNRGQEQYEKLGALDEQDFFTVREGKAKLKVNLKAYLDTGLFLDHRPLRLRLADEAQGKEFLNLFCYTASASVHAALGGAKATTSVDMSNTYLDWAQKNFELNRLNESKHELVRADVMHWLGQCRRGYDLIMLDPPSFSNSKKMAQSFDVQRDHVFLLKRCMELLKPGGVLYFSNNLRSFKLSDEILTAYRVEDISRQSIDKDFARNSKIHRCFRLEQK
ncbi:bifunctional 23S rRNA (guanine(2069)-N(7))-methyltransferase RlmK/23S rRNA (guanine(2445)-N(2))-methyltransferase RlmL [Agaribacterium haliotis]|uniref:bifunctional 23S rRNA (guanine(2069)-N(7))-methyltransferase RlmK/23S rRNA (guanine(2445)-N(2))-methyltransferase RlmL n=1 Tax=Agaribacterium haliotis TaxID=2013869 RepID=UPI000BB56180|nr:bifunctional 23S rRNA (guanine(2069)-N(7))-methyltransferase RlmK/23S rRNA (guanine(2445)-N(2))-methyltransferase RlmL [Agaribacterium haliotis]